MNIVTFTLLLAAFICQSQVCRANQNSYGAVVVEFKSSYRTVPSTNSTQKNIYSNLEQYVMFIAEAKRLNADIIIFPERGLSDVFSFPVPEVSSKTIPCNDSAYDLKDIKSAVLKRISCAARDNHIYVIVNLPESRNTGVSLWRQKKTTYSTNVGFDREGKVVLRYAKFNAYDIFIFKKPKKIEYSYFTSDFGVRFASFSGLDIFFTEPMNPLINKYNVTDFIYTGHWLNIMPFLTATSLQAGWAYSKNVNLLAAGYNNPGAGYTGSGVYIGKRGAAVSLMSEYAQSEILFVRVPIGRNRDFETGQISGSVLNRGSPSQLTMEYDSLKSYSSEKIPNGENYESTICNGGTLCCRFKVLVRTKRQGYGNYHYRAAVFGGTRRFGYIYIGMEICGVIFCNGENLSNCTKRLPNIAGINELEYAEISGNFTTKDGFHMPITLVDQGKLTIMEPNKFEFHQNNNSNNGTVIMTLRAPVDNVYTFAIFGRNYSEVKGSASKASFFGFVPTSALVCLTYWYFGH